MAFLLPENLGSRSDVPQAVRDVATALRDLVEDDVTVWLEGEDDEPYLVVLDPASGVLLVHVVSGGARTLTREAGKILKRLEAVPFEDLVAGLDGCQQALVQQLRRTASVSQVPVAVTAAVPRADRAAIAAAGFDDPGRFLTKDDLRAGVTRTAIGRIVGRSGAPTRLTEPQERTVRAKLYPEIVIRRPEAQSADGQMVFRPPADGGEDVIAVLDREQERLARHLGSGYRVIKGVAGSGKTLALTFRARFLAEAFPSKSFLVCCYNRPLADALGVQLVDLPNVKVSTLDGLAWRVCQKAGVRLTGSGDEMFRQQRAEALKVMQNRPLRDLRFAAVLLDEAQDLDDVGTELAHAFLDDGEDQFIIALDGAQNIYRRQSRWTPPGTSGRGRTKLLRLNYRNTREILDVAYKFLQAGASTETLEAEIDDPHVIVPPEASARSGPYPKVVQCASVNAAMTEVTSGIRAAHDAGARWRDTAVLVGNAKVRKQLFYAMKDAGIPYHDASHSPEAKKELVRCGDKVVGATIQIVKGLEFPHVYLLGLDDVQAGRGADDETKRRLVYVGMTRATDTLTVALHGEGTIVSDLLTAVS
ncbi:MAG: DEAD/DEAH box helicase [Acidimicrobiales bacterium]